MNYKVVYFTRTGNCKRIAEKISKKLECEMIQVTDNKKWTGVSGFMRGGYYSSMNRKVEIKTTKKIDSYDELVVISPLWASGITPAIKKFLETVPMEKVNLVISSSGSILKKPKAYKTISNVIENKKNEDEVIDNLLKTLLKNKG